MPIISIIVPVYKSEEYIDRCIKSILDQTFTDFELILVDDGSPDNCPQICDKWAKCDSRIVVIHKKNGGVSSARNEGLKIASGEYIMFCDSDDIVYPNWCEILLFLIKKYPHTLVASNVTKLNEIQAIDAYNSFTHASELLLPPFSQAHQIKTLSYFELYKLGISGYTVNKIFLRNTILSNNIFFDPKLPIAEDVHFIAKYCICSKIKECIFFPHTTYIYIQNEDSALHKKHADWLGFHLNSFKFRLPLISEDEMGEYCDIWLYQFIKMFDYIFDKSIKMSYISKMKYNQKMLCSEEFQFCLQNCTGKNENPKIIKLLKNKRYYGYHIRARLSRIKHIFC